MLSEHSYLHNASVTTNISHLWTRNGFPDAPHAAAACSRPAIHQQFDERHTPIVLAGLSGSAITQ